MYSFGKTFHLEQNNEKKVFQIQTKPKKKEIEKNDQRPNTHTSAFIFEMTHSKPARPLPALELIRDVKISSM